MITTFHRPQTIEEAVTLQKSLGKRACFLAGGTTVNSSDSTFTGDCVISLAGLGLDDIHATASETTIGACCTITQLLESSDVPAPVKAAARHVANRNIRNIAAVGGHIATNKSCGDLLPILVALDAVLDTLGQDGAGRVSVLEYLGINKSQKKDIPLITNIRIPKPVASRAFAVDRYSRTVNDISILTVAVALSKEGDLIRDPIIAAGGVAQHVIRLKGMERKLAGADLPCQDDIEKWTAEEIAPVSDLRGSEAFKRYRAGVLIATALQSAYLDQGGMK